MRFDDRFLDEIKSRLRLSDVIGKTLKLRRQGREYAGLSPFTTEKSPSFFVDDDEGFYHCFSSGKHGDLISFLQETERLTFPEAVERLANEAGLALPAVDPRSVEEEKKKQSLGDWLETAAKWFEAELRRPGGAGARAYLAKRALPEADWSRFRLGFAPAGRNGLKDYLIAKGAFPGELVDTGLLIAPEDEGAAPYDRFRDRIIFPITDARGRVVSFGGRAMDPQARAKYLNGPETSLFHKGAMLYGLAEAKKLLSTGPADEVASLVVVEGYMDVIACQRSGIAALAPMGTALTEEQMDLLWRLHPEPTVALDGDTAGRRAASRAIDRALPLLKAGRSLKFAVVKGGKDPDDVLREQGPGALKAQLAETTPFVDALFTRERDIEPLDTPERRSALKSRLRAAAALIADKDLAGEYRSALLERFDALFARDTSARPTAPGGARVWRRDPRRPAWEDAPMTPEGRNGLKSLARSIDPVAAALAKWALLDPGCLDDSLESLEAHGFGDPALNDLAREIIRLRLSADVLDSEALQRHLAACGFSALLGEIDKAALKSGAPFLVPDATPSLARSHWSYAFAHVTRLAALESEIESAKSSLADRSDMEALERLKAQRDLARREIRDGTIWAGGGS
ncbi:DNA primase [soil metagenome]